MTARTLATKPTPGTKLLRYHTVDSFTGVTRETALAIARQLGMTEAQLIHRALVDFIERMVPQCVGGNESITHEQWAALNVISAQTTHGESVGKLL